MARVAKWQIGRTVPYCTLEYHKRSMGATRLRVFTPTASDFHTDRPPFYEPACYVTFTRTWYMNFGTQIFPLFLTVNYNRITKEHSRTVGDCIIILLETLIGNVCLGKTFMRFL